MRHLLLSVISFFIIILSAYAESIPYENLVGVWASSQDGVNHDLTQAHVPELCGRGFLILHPDRNLSTHIRLKQDGKLLGSMDVLSKQPCTYADNQLNCQVEASASGKSLGVNPFFVQFNKVRDDVYDMTSLKPDGQMVDKVQTAYRCPLTIPEALAWVKANSEPGELGEKMGEIFSSDKVEWLKKKEESGDARAQAGMGALYLMAAMMNTGVEHDPERGLALLEQAAAQGEVDAYVMLGNANALSFLAKQPEDYATAQAWYAKAAQAGHPGAKNAVGFLLLFGLPEQNAVQAKALMTRAAEQGHSSAHFNLGVIEVFFPDDFRKKLGLPLEKDVLSGMMHIKLAEEQGLKEAFTIWQALKPQLNQDLTGLIDRKLKEWKDKHPIVSTGSYVYPSSDVRVRFKFTESGELQFTELNIAAVINWDTMTMEPIYDLHSTSETLEDKIGLVQRCAALFQVTSERMKAEKKDPDDPYLQSKIRSAAMFEKQAGVLEKSAAEAKGDMKSGPEESQRHIEELQLLYHQRMDRQQEKTGDFLSEQDTYDLGACQQIYNNLTK